MRPHVCLSGALPPAFASWGILPRPASGWHLLSLAESTGGVTSFLWFVLRILRVRLYTGFIGVNPGRDGIRQALILSHFGQANSPRRLVSVHDALNVCLYSYP